MKKVAIVAPGVLPVPATHGGAIENLVEFLIGENEKNPCVDLSIFSTNKGQDINTSKYAKTKFHFIDDEEFTYKIGRAVRGVISRMTQSGEKEYIHRVKRTLKKGQYDYIIIENKPQYVLPIKKVTDAKIILHMHNDFITADMPNAMEIINACHKIITVSDFIKGRIRKVSQDARIETVHNGIDTKRFARPLKKNANKKFTFAYTGRVTPEKGLPELMEAFERLLLTHSDVQLVIVGGSKFKGSKQTTFVSEVESFAEKYKDNVTVTGFVDYAFVPKYLEQSDVVVVPSKCGEPFATTVLESICTGSTLITTNDGGIPEMVDETCAYICDTKNLAEDLFKNMELAYSRRNIDKLLAENIYARRSLFAKERFAKNFYSAILKGES